MDSTTHQSYQNQNNQANSGLLRFHSVPSSFLTNFNDKLDSRVYKGGFDSDRLISRFINSAGDKDKSGKEAAVHYANSQQSYSGLPPHYPRQNSAMDSSYELLGMNHNTQGIPVTSSLMRQSSSPPAHFTNLSVQNGYGDMKGLGNYCGVNNTNGELSQSSNILKNQMSSSSRLISTLGTLSQFSEIGNEGIGANSLGDDDDGKLENCNNEARFFGSEYHYNSWNDSARFTENFSGLKRTHSTNQSGDLGSRIHVLSHHLSLPKTSNEMKAVEKYLHFQDSVPWKIRAKRGCATHPRSIAERVRRTRISERMKKLQELVPSMDKQTNTADMLDLAVDYIKELQKQFKTLSDYRAKCKCLSTQKPFPNQMV